jgi:hypothetical protein
MLEDIMTKKIISETQLRKIISKEILSEMPNRVDQATNIINLATELKAEIDNLLASGLGGVQDLVTLQHELFGDGFENTDVLLTSLMLMRKKITSEKALRARTPEQRSASAKKASTTRKHDQARYKQERQKSQERAALEKAEWDKGKLPTSIDNRFGYSKNPSSEYYHESPYEPGMWFLNHDAPRYVSPEERDKILRRK